MRRFLDDDDRDCVQSDGDSEIDCKKGERLLQLSYAVRRVEAPDS